MPLFRDYKIKHAQDIILADYGDIVSVDEKKKDLLKFGRNTNVGTASTGYTIWATGADQANETYVATNTNSIDSISSGASGDTSKSLVVEGHTESGGNKTFVSQSVTTNASNGQTRVAYHQILPILLFQRMQILDSLQLAQEPLTYRVELQDT